MGEEGGHSGVCATGDGLVGVHCVVVVRAARLALRGLGGALSGLAGGDLDRDDGEGRDT